MLEDRQSKFKLYSKGIVVEDKPRDSKIVKVCPIEELPNIPGKLMDYKLLYDIELPDVKGVTKRSVIEGSSWIEAEWLPLHQSNRLTAPDLIKNETVQIYRYADSEKYYWDTHLREDHIRRLETVTYGFNNSSVPLEECDDNKQYTVTVSTHDKYLEFKTVDTDGEVTTYKTRFDMKTGNIEIIDKQGNVLTLNSTSGTWAIKANTEVIVDSPLSTFKGNVVIEKDLTVKGSLTVTGGLSASTINASGTVTAAAFVTA